MKIIFVDGYNVINCWPNLKSDKKEGLEGSRQKLIRKMENYGTYNNSKIIVVFDAHMVQGSIEKQEEINKLLTVVFTKNGETADAFIEREVDAIGRKYDVCVVTSDNLEQQTIFQRGAARKSSHEFYKDVKIAENKIEIETEKNKINQKNNLSDNIDKDVLMKLEAIRRSK
ncbi:NYN domain-containing protein [uncultured Clostridium sp.]|uniref:NYN domain-containing protein n=1 Tax=uncultured Clostridium sp. TaxID=59620 RepID=UPI0026080AEE|nr:NYN domain-containing protein [uncultured Clostridium sp.]